MKKITATLAITVLLYTTLTPIAQAEKKEIQSIPLKKTEKLEKNYREGEVIIKYKSAEKKEEAIQDIEKSLFKKKIQGIKIKDEIDDLNIALIKSDKKSTEELIEEYENDKNIEYVSPNYIKTPAFTPNDPSFSDQWAHYRSDDHDIDSTDAWDIERDPEIEDATETIVAVIDSGVDHNFSDLENNMWDGSSSCFSDIGASISCPNHGWDYLDDDNDPDDTSSSYQWHGTHVASVFGAITNNATGMSGISRYNTIKIMALRFNLDTISEIRAINFAKNNGAKVINASFTGTAHDQPEKDAIDAFPGIVVAAAGNDENSNDATPQYPCNYASSNVICVGASDQSDNIASFSNYGESVDIAAPGDYILGIQQDAYYYGYGTSLAAPLVAGATALLYAHDPGASISTIRDTLLKSSDHLNNLSGKIACSRRLNVDTALQNIINSTIPTEICSSPIYRFWSSKLQGHFFTASNEEKNIVINNYDDYTWLYEGIGFRAHTSQVPDTLPVYRFWSPRNQHHFYTASEEEKNIVINNYDDYVWTYEGVAYHAYTTSLSGTTPIYRFWSPQNQSHFYTASEEEKNIVINNYDDYVWTYEGVAFYVPQD